MSAQKETSLVLRVCKPDFTSRGGFVWPSSVGASVSAPDWDDEAACGNGLHGWLYGQGDHDCVAYHSLPGSKWLVLEVCTSDIVLLDEKCKFPKAVVRFIGNRLEATSFIIANEPRAQNTPVIGSCLVVGDSRAVQVGALGVATAGREGTATAGDEGTATVGYEGMATAGDYGTATAGDYGTATAGDKGTATAGGYGTATAGYKGTATAGDYGTATAGHGGTATAGHEGTATAGHGGTATAGHKGTATAGYEGTARASESGEIRIQWRDEPNIRYRTVIGYVGEKGIKPDTFYRLNDDHEFEEVTE